MTKLPVISGRDAVKRFMALGYRVARQRGSHIRLIHPSGLQHKALSVPNHPELRKGLLRKLLRDAQITVEQFCKLV